MPTAPAAPAAAPAENAVIHPASYLFVLNDPGHAPARELEDWIARSGGNVKLYTDSPAPCIDVQYNGSVAAALATRHPATGELFDRFVFLDDDLRPDANSMRDFWTAPGDVVGARYTTNMAHAWEDGVIHMACWRTTRHVLDTLLQPPYTLPGDGLFQWTYKPGHTALAECLCKTFCRKVAAAGFSIGRGGLAWHEVDRPGSDGHLGIPRTEVKHRRRPATGEEEKAA